MPLTGIITNISRTSLHDGPGVRTVVYFKGCGLRCAWCHNPETFSLANDILYAEVKCIHCGKCVLVCPEHHKIVENKMVFERNGCIGSNKCVLACPSGALSSAGKEISAEKLLSEIKKDTHYYNATGGGVTLSGGECLLQADFCAELLQKCKAEGIDTLIETALYVPWQSIEKVLPHCDAFFADLKLPAPEKHAKFTGHDNSLILENLARLSKNKKGAVTLRIPLIPTVNDTLSSMAEFAKIILPLAEDLCGVELLRYNNLAGSKYTQLAKEYRDFGIPQTTEHIQMLCSELENLLQSKTKVFAKI